MLREEQIDIRRRRAAEESLCIQNLGRNRVFSDYQVTNPTTGGQYRVSIRGFDVGDNHCDCPDFRTNTLGTCKHVEAVLAALRDETPPQLRRRKAAVTHPEIYLQYTANNCASASTCRRATPTSCTPWPKRFFDGQGVWKAGDHYQNLIEAVENVPGAGDDLVRRHGVHGAGDRAQGDGRARAGLAQPAGARGAVAGSVRPAESAALPLPDARGGVPGLSRPLRPRRRHGTGQDRADVGGGGAAGPRTRRRARAGGGAGLGEISVGNRDPEVHRPAGADRRGQRRRAPRACTNSRRSTALSTTKWRCATWRS